MLNLARIVCWMLTEQFSAETSSLLEDIVKLMDNADASLLCSNWDDSDPDLEKSVMDDLQGWKLDTFNKIGGPGALRDIWCRIKNLKQVVGIKQ